MTQDPQNWFLLAAALYGCSATLLVIGLLAMFQYQRDQQRKQLRKHRSTK